MPHITESLYGHITEGKVLADDRWIQNTLKTDEKIEQEIETIQNIVRTVRNIRAEKQIKPSDKRNVWIVAMGSDKEMIEENSTLIEGLAKIDTLSLEKPNEDKDMLAYDVVRDIDIFVDARVDESAKQAEIDRLKEQIEDKKDYLRIINKKLSNPSFTANAPQQVVRSEMDKKNQAALQLEKLEEKLGKLI